MSKVPESSILRQVTGFIPRNICYLRDDGSTIICNYDYFDPFGFYDIYYDQRFNAVEEPPCQTCHLRSGRQALIKDGGFLYTAWKGALVREEK